MAGGRVGPTRQQTLNNCEIFSGCTMPSVLSQTWLPSSQGSSSLAGPGSHCLSASISLVSLCHSHTPIFAVRRDSPLDSQLIKRCASVQWAFDESLPGLPASIKRRHTGISPCCSPGQAFPQIRLQWAWGWGEKTYVPFQSVSGPPAMGGERHSWFCLNDLQQGQEYRDHQVNRHTILTLCCQETQNIESHSSF